MMGAESYPVDHNGIALPTFEVVPDYVVNSIRHEEKKNWQHLQWTRRQYGKQFLYFCFRSLETRQELIPVEIHDWVHENFDPPRFPHPTTMLHEIIKASEMGQKMHVRSPEKRGGYVEQEIGSEILKRCLDNWHDLKHN